MLSLKLRILIFSPSGDVNPIVNSGIGLIDVDLSSVIDDVFEVTGKIGSVSSVEVLIKCYYEVFLKNYYYLGMYFH